MATSTESATIERIGPYIVERKIGEGAHGTVYAAHHRDKPSTTVALKVVENRGNLDRLLLEPEILSKLRHPGIVGLQDYFIDNDRLVVSLEFLNGGDLKAWSKAHGQFNAAETRDFMRQMASALQHAHEAGVLHRDIKPANIIVVEGRDGPRYVLTDFGISRISEGLQVSRKTGGTYHFMAPEQLRGRPTAQSDLWALGVVAYQLLTSELPFGGETVKELAAEVLYKSPVPLASLLKDFHDDELAEIIYGTLEKQPANRIDSAAALLQQLGGGHQTKTPVSQNVRVQALTIDAQAQRKVRRYTVGCVMSALLWSGPLLTIPTTIVLAGLWCFYQGQRAIFHRHLLRGSSFTLGGLLLLLIGYVVTQAFLPAVLAGLHAGGVDVNKFGSAIILGSTISIVLFSLIFVPLTVYLFSKLRAQHREIGLRRAITENSGDTDKQLDILGAMAQELTEDLVVRQKYAEALLAHGRQREAVVEAKLMLNEDPYNMAAGLLLAHSYFELGLNELTISVCDAFLDIAGYCFEFRELRDLASQSAGVVQ
ncbi:MAG: serine/threonine protein kinase [Planctomycetaceae bacterium]|nr:serine/threonine protein kinase [Planctomycetaceae bacterium]